MTERQAWEHGSRRIERLAMEAEHEWALRAARRAESRPNPVRLLAAGAARALAARLASLADALDPRRRTAST